MALQGSGEQQRGCSAPQIVGMTGVVSCGAQLFEWQLQIGDLISGCEEKSVFLIKQAQHGSVYGGRSLKTLKCKEFYGLESD